MKKSMNRLLSIVIALVLLTGGILGARALLKSKPEAERRRSMSAMVPVVETVALPIADQAVHLDVLGTVIGDKTAVLQAEVSGRITAVSSNLVEGTRIKKGEVLIEIESVDYELAVAKAEADLLTAQSNYRIEEGQQDVVRNELELMGGDVSDSYRDLMLREPQLKVAEATVKSAELSLESAKKNLLRTRILAPYDAVVVSVDAGIGDFAQSSGTLVELAATDRYFIRASVPLRSLESVPKLGVEPYAAEVMLSDGSTRPAQTYRLLPELTETGRMAQILLTVDAPYHASWGRPLLLNESVRIRITGEFAEKSSLIPRKYLHDGNVVWMMDAERKLRIFPVELLQSYEDHVLVRVEGAGGMELITTEITAAVEGMQLRKAGEARQAQEKRQDEPKAPAGV
ncbi:efflux RND transporter periplasmic adaptor subunit [Kiritimatiellaeota bacterium B1221]|nr:efflux RND transporter periplasmic adaptor subunit [Kiritimatiellaeota bacterium B1221]